MNRIVSIALSVLFAVVAIWLLLKLLGAALKIVAVLIGLGLAFIVYKFAVRAIGGGRNVRLP